MTTQLNSLTESDTENTDYEPVIKHPRIDTHDTESAYTSELFFSGSSTSAVKYQQNMGYKPECKSSLVD